MRPRPARIWALAWRDLRRVNAGQGWYRLPLLALGLLLPVGALRLPTPSLPRAAEPLAVSGSLPPALQGRVSLDPAAPVKIVGQAPLQVEAAAVPVGLRVVLDAVSPGPKVALRSARPPVRLPGRSLLVALLAVSLLTGPLAESVPGERSARTLEVLLSAAITRTELVAGKWLAWTGFGAVGALLAAAGGLLSGAQAPGLWPLALPLVVGGATAVGLWLVRRATDVVGGAAIPMRTLPALCLALAGLAWGVAGASPLLGAAVPLGGALLVAGGVLSGWGPLLAAGAGTGLATAALLRRTARDLDDAGPARPAAQGGLGPALAAIALCWLCLAGPGVWALAGNPNLELHAGAAQAASGLLSGGLAAVLAARQAAWPRLAMRRSGALLALGLGLALAALHSRALWTWSGGALAPFAAVLLRPPDGVAAALIAAAGQAALFWGVLLSRAGRGAVPLTALAFTVAVLPFSPALGLLSGLALATLSRRFGVGAAALAHGIWLVAWALRAA